MIRENQQPIDEFISLLFEIVNSTGEKQFLALSAKAEAGTISKSDFVRDVGIEEFKATKRVRDLLRKMTFNKNETLNSYFYKRFKDTPDDYEAFDLYSKKVSPNRDVTKDVESEYDFLQKH
ncbi:MAG: hypothetical protein JWR19_1176 [Pedosphaera sp.]|nr:hypothetical protein [Pedosphaera sp.]